VLVRNINRNHFFGYLREKGIGVNVHYIPTYRFSYYTNHIPVNFIDFPVTEDVFNRIITLPLHPGMTKENIVYIAETIHKFKK
jgi:dTDP-4-amino-4,6-dideoxygalactose transaminase